MPKSSLILDRLEILVKDNGKKTLPKTVPRQRWQKKANRGARQKTNEQNCCPKQRQKVSFVEKVLFFSLLEKKP